MRIELEQTTAVVIDCQEKLMPVMQNKVRLVENTSILLAGLRVLGVPIDITQQYTKGLGMTIPEITEVVRTEKYIEKNVFSAYNSIATAIEGKTFVIICGIEAHICVLQTMIDLKAQGYQPVLVVDCIESRKENDKKIAIKRAREEGAVITTYESLLFELLKEAGTNVSKQIQRLIK